MSAFSRVFMDAQLSFTVFRRLLSCLGGYMKGAVRKRLGSGLYRPRICCHYDSTCSTACLSSLLWHILCTSYFLETDQTGPFDPHCPLLLRRRKTPQRAAAYDFFMVICAALRASRH